MAVSRAAARESVWIFNFFNQNNGYTGTVYTRLCVADGIPKFCSMLFYSTYVDKQDRMIPTEIQLVVTQ